MGATPFQIITNVMIPECLPGLISSMTTALTTILGLSLIHIFAVRSRSSSAADGLAVQCIVVDGGVIACLLYTSCPDRRRQ